MSTSLSVASCTWQMTFSFDGLIVSKVLPSTPDEAQQLFLGYLDCNNTFDEFIIDKESCRLLVAAVRRLKLFGKRHDEWLCGRRCCVKRRRMWFEIRLSIRRIDRVN